jgi:DNA-directed RNA polymerase subunit RPC12/RpoP
MQSHKLAKTIEMAFMCKKCKKAFRKDMAQYEESDEYCPHCDNHYVRVLLGLRALLIRAISQVLEAKTPHAVIGVEGDDTRIDSRYTGHRIMSFDQVLTVHLQDDQG